MPKTPVVSGQKAVKALTRMGFTVTRQKGSHIILRRGSCGCVVPNHKVIKTGTLLGILKQAGISLNDFIENL